MADTVDTQVVLTSPTWYIVKLTNESDGTGESAVVKIDKSTLTDSKGNEPLAVDVYEIEYSINGFNYIVLEWAHTTNDEIAVLSGNGYTDFGGQPAADPRSSGGAGDVVLTTDGAIDGAHYTITLKCKLRRTA